MVELERRLGIWRLEPRRHFLEMITLVGVVPLFLIAGWVTIWTVGKLALLALVLLAARSVLARLARPRAFAKWLDGSLTLKDRRVLATKARELWAKAPTRAAAYEVAALCGLADVGLLYRLAWRVTRHRFIVRDHPIRVGGMPRAASIARMFSEPGHAMNRLYRNHTIPKRGGGMRTIAVPRKDLRHVQRRVLHRLLGQVTLHEAATGFRPGYSTVDNAKPHVGQRLVVNLDIASCFDSTSYAQVLRACRIAGKDLLSPRAIRFLAELCSSHGSLPTGAPTSPAITNIVLTAADRAIATVAARHGIQYTRYADDLTFSGNGDIHRMLPFVVRVLGGLGYAIAPDKVNFFRRGRRQMVTGLVVNERVNLPRRTRRQLRAAVHRASQGRPAAWNGAEASTAVLLGLISYLKVTQPHEAARLRAKLVRPRSQQFTALPADQAGAPPQQCLTPP